jgi:hypothetical protein
MSERLRSIVASLDVRPDDRVGLFHREPARARRLAERWLMPGGTLRSVYD